MDEMTRALYGCHAVHVGMNLIMQNQGDGTVIIVAQSRIPEAGAHPLLFGSQRTHVLCLGDIVVRPHLVCASDSFRGEGLSNLIRTGFVSTDKWLQGDVILDNLPRLNELKAKS